MRDEAVDESVADVLGEVEDAGGGIEGDGFVLEASEALEGARLGESAVGAGGDFEGPAVVLCVLIVGELFGFLAGDPCAPGGGSAGAVVLGACQREEVADESPGAGVVDERGDASEGRPVGAGRAGVVEAVGVDAVEQFVVPAEGPFARGEVGDFVVAHEDGQAVGAGEGGHAVVQRGDEEAVVHALAVLGDHVVGEAGGEVDDAERIGLEGAEEGVGVECGILAGFEGEDEAVEAGETERESGGVAEEVSSGES